MVSPNIEYIYIYIYVFYVALTMTAVKDQRALTSTSGGCHGFLHLQIERYIQRDVDSERAQNWATWPIVKKNRSGAPLKPPPPNPCPRWARTAAPPQSNSVRA